MAQATTQKNVVIVESPAKARTIARYLGKDFAVVSSFGHIRDLPKKGLGVDIEHDFAPSYEVSSDKKKVVADLKRQTKGATVWLASDEDREGEAIAWHLCEVLGLDPQSTKRIVFHEITKPAIIRAIEQPRSVDKQLVDAQQARRVLDRLVGYKLSPVLWRKVRAGLSAGRVQSVAVRLIVEREREIRAFTAEASYKVTAELSAGNKDTLNAELDTKLNDKMAARAFLEACKEAQFTVGSVDQKPGQRNPGAPFTTSTLQQEAARRLGFSVKQTMTLAQRLYENGHITYMRTDSTNLSEEALSASLKYITDNFGKDYARQRTYQTKSQGAQEAHEAVRPSNLQKTEAGDDANQNRLYKLIWQRMVASQMAAARIEKSEIHINISSRQEKLVAKGEVLTFDGFLKVYGGGKEDRLLPAVKTGQQLTADYLTASQVFSRPPARFSEASLVRQLEEMGIGRPSTYSPTISVIQDRGYIEKSDLPGEERTVHSLRLEGSAITENDEKVTVGADRAKLVPTHLADMTTDFLVKHFREIVDYDFTAKAEETLDAVAEGKTTWQTMIGDFYKEFEPKIKQSESVSRAETSQARTLGTDPGSRLPIIVRFGRYGPMLQKGEAVDKDTKLEFASLPEGTTLETITLEQALPMFDLPRTVGTTKEGESILANTGRYGPYIQVGKQYVSIKGLDPLTITEDEARQLYEERRTAAANKTIQDFGKVKILRGPYGPYVTDGKKNARIPKNLTPEQITVEEAAELLAKAPAKRSKRRIKK